jgi:hypothetical protein
MSKAESIRNAIESSPPEDAVGGIYDLIEDKFYSSGYESLNPKQKLFFAVNTFLGQVLNGGLMQYLTSDYGISANEVSVGFQQIGMPELSKIAAKMMADVSASVIPSDDDERCELFESVMAKKGGDGIDKIEKPFWDFKWAQSPVLEKQVDAALFRYLKANFDDLVVDTE